MPSKVKNKFPKKDKQISNQESKHKSLKDIYGKKHISLEMTIQTTFEIENKQTIPYCSSPNISEEIPKKILDGLVQDLSTNRIILNFENLTLESKSIELIDNASEVICLSSFLLENKSPICNALYRASKRGVRIYLLLASENQVANLTEKEDIQLAQEHLQFLRESSGYMMIRCGEFHAKYILIDPNSQKASGILLTANLTQRALTLNKDIGILLDNEEASQLFRHFCFGFWIQRQHQYEFNLKKDTSKLVGLPPLSGYLPIITINSEIIWTSQDTKTISNSIEEMLQGINEDDEILISSWNFTFDNSVSEQLLSVINKKTMILLPFREKNYEAFRRFSEKGAQIRCNSLQHAKFIITSQKAIIFSANFESQGMDSGFEAGIIIQDPIEIDILRQIFLIWFKQAESIILSKEPVSNLIGTTVALIPETETKQNPSTKEIKIEAQQTGSPIRQILSVQTFLALFQSRPEDLKKIFQNEGHLSPISYAAKTLIPIDIRPRKVPENVSYVKFIEGFHIWQDDARKTNPQKYLVFEKNPLENKELFEKALEIANAEGAICVLY